MQRITVHMSENGRVLIPAQIRKQLGFIAGEPITLELDGEALRLMTQGARIRAAQASAATYLPKDRDVVAEFLAERREEARRELEDE